MEDKKEYNIDETLKVSTAEIIAINEEKEANKKKHWYDPILNIFKKKKNK